MSDFTTRATVTLQVNGQSAQQTLQQLRENALRLETAIAKAAAAGNKTDLRRLRRELTDTKRQIREIESATTQVEEVLRHLDSATPKELQSTLQNLNRQLNYIERGSSAWVEHTQKIKAVKAEIAKVNAELRDQEGFWTRFNRVMNDWQTTIMGAAAAITGLIMAGRSAVQAFAEMDAELANVRKYTGMTSGEVDSLNEKFKEMDTRTARQELNQLAEEAGRLGKQSEEDVLGFVRAADKINVALDDLGSGATLTLSKLTNIFGDEERLGTEEALLSVGSVINELSQNCTASAPYLANFAQRMAGVGAQAGLTIPQIMAFGAVLDSQGQACEMSATALSKLTMDLFKDTERVAKATGIPLQQLKEVLAEGTNEGLILLLEKLHDLGSMDVLAPVFKDMGENGARASQVIAALAGNIETVKWEQEEAAKAFNEATSVTNEYNVQNTTVEAGLEKARKRVTEMAVELGEKLVPVMSHVISSTSALLRVMSIVVSFVLEHKTAIVTTTAAVIAYTVAVNASNIAFKVHYAWLVVTSTAQKALAATTATLRTALVLLQMAMAKIEGNYARVKLLQLELNTAMKANAFGLIAAAAVALIAVFVKLYERMKEVREAQQVLNNIKKEAVSRAQEQIDKVNLLVAAARNENLSLKERQQAVENLNKIIPGYNAQIDATTGKLREGTQALKDYIEQLKRKYEVEGAKEMLAQIGKRRAELKIEKAELQKEKEDMDRGQRELESQNSTGTQAYGVAGVTMAQTTAIGSTVRRHRVNSGIADADRELAQLEARERTITGEYGDDIQRDAVATSTPKSSGGGGGTATPPSGSSGGSSSGSTGKEDKFEKEKEWKEREEALNRIAYAKGEKDYAEYQQRMEEIAVLYAQKKLEHTDLTENERLSIQAEYYEAVKKQSENAEKRSVEEENAAYNELLAVLKQRFIDGESTQKVYEEAAEQLEIAHLQKLVSLYEEGSKEYLQAQKSLQDKLLANQKKHQKEAEDAEKKHQEALKKMKAEYFGDNPQERQSKFAADLALLTEVYNAEVRAAGDNAKEKLRIEKAFQQAKLALMEKYNIEGRRANMNALQRWNEDLQDFLDSDVGKAVEGSVDVLVSGMSSIFSQLSSIVSAELEIQAAAIEKKYDREISLAEGNNYKVKQLEKQKEAEIVKAKKEANKKMFAMQVIQAVAQTATAALNAYSSAAAIPVVGWVMAPIAASLAVAAGALQIASIKKQQQASEAQGYARGGFTPPGRKDEEVGVVHAGEWVASQELVQDPTVRPILEVLDHAQRTNTIGNLSAEDVSQSITAPAVLARTAAEKLSSPQRVVVENSSSGPDSSALSASLSAYTETMQQLKDRLNEPFVTVNSVTGELGMKQAQDEYDRLMRNKTPKSRR